MECKTCKQKNQKSNNSEKQNKGNSIGVNLISEEIQNGNYNGNFFFKVIAFFAISIALPLILLVLVGQVFLTFFLPKSLPKVRKKFFNFFTRILNVYGKFKYNKEIKKREKQFGENISYDEKSEDDVNFNDIEIFNGKENKK